MNQDALLYRRLFGRFATGVAVVMSEFEGDVVGMTVNSLTSVSLDPLLLLFCARNGSRSAQAVLGTGRFSVNILNGQQQDIARGFAGSKHVSCLSDCVRSGGFAWLPRSNAVFLCESKNIYPGGDHRIVLGSVIDMSGHDGVEDPLVYFDGQYTGLKGLTLASSEAFLTDIHKTPRDPSIDGH